MFSLIVGRPSKVCQCFVTLSLEYFLLNAFNSCRIAKYKMSPQQSIQTLFILRSVSCSTCHMSSHKHCKLTLTYAHTHTFLPFDCSKNGQNRIIMHKPFFECFLMLDQLLLSSALVSVKFLARAIVYF